MEHIYLCKLESFGKDNFFSWENFLLEREVEKNDDMSRWIVLAIYL